jgi:3-isopropylmalate dehydrogenase
MNNKKLLVLAGDGIGPECVEQTLRVVDWFSNKRSLAFDIQEDLVGGAAYDAHGTSLTDATMQKAVDADAILFGSVGGPKWDGVARELRPENGLLRLRKRLDLFANLRPAYVFPALAEASSLKTELVSGLDIMIIRELTGGVYFGEPKEITTLPDGSKRAIDSQIYTTQEIARTARVAFDLGRQRGNKVCSVEKSNVMETGVLWREVVSQIHRDEYPDVELSHMLADACAMQLLRAPKQFEIIVTDNLFGDMLSDEAAMLTGSIGMLPSASLGAPDAQGRRPALYEPCHGSAPDIAGMGIANPLAEIMSFAMLLRYSFALSVEADLIEQAVANVLDSGVRTGDIMQPGKTKVSTTGMGDAVLSQLDALAA